MGVLNRRCVISQVLGVFTLVWITASASADEGVWIKKALDQELHNSKMWRRLLHMNGEESYIDDEKFFLSDLGKKSPKMELQSTITALLSSPSIHCRYPARSSWLHQRIGLPIPEIECKDLEQWKKAVSAASVSLVFASSYLNSPSSMYGHTFMKFAFKEQGEGADLVSYALNFGAVVEESDNGFLYAFNGLLGAYPGFFSDGPYYKKIQEYSRLDNRDVWEYKLNLSENEIDRLMGHLWELKDIQFDYYFFDENCSFRLLELLEVARESVSLTEEFGLWAIPIDTVSVVIDEGMVESVRFRPSHKQILKQDLEKLSSAEQQYVKDLSEGNTSPSDKDITNLPLDRQYLVVDGAYRYLRYTVGRGVRTEENSSRSFSLLKHLKKLSAHKAAEKASYKPPEQPELGHETSSAQVSMGSLDGQAFASISGKPSYHDLLDNALAFPSGLSLSLGRAEIRVYEDDGIEFERLDVVDITSVSARDNFFHPWSWRVKGGFERKWFNEGRRPLVGHVSGGGGLTYGMLGNWVSYGFAQGRLEANDVFEHYVDLAGGLGVGLLYQTPSLSISLQADTWFFTGGEKRFEYLSGFQVPLARNHAIRFEGGLSDVKRGQSWQFQGGYRFYF